MGQALLGLGIRHFHPGGSVALAGGELKRNYARSISMDHEGGADGHRCYSFRPVAEADLPRLSPLALMTPEVARWWGDPSREFEGLRADLCEPQMTMRIVSFRGRAFAYAQDYLGPRLAAGPSRSSALGRAGDRQLYRIAVDDRSGPRLGLPPSPRLSACGRKARRSSPSTRSASNLRARRAYAKAGFVGETSDPDAERTGGRDGLRPEQHFPAMTANRSDRRSHAGMRLRAPAAAREAVS